jgi:hypothetical protein
MFNPADCASVILDVAPDEAHRAETGAELLVDATTATKTLFFSN